MRVRVLLFAGLRDIVGSRELELIVEAGATARDVYDLMQEQYPDLAGIRSSTTIAVNRDVVQATERLRDGDEVVFLQPASGGCFD